MAVAFGNTRKGEQATAAALQMSRPRPPPTAQKPSLPRGRIQEWAEAMGEKQGLTDRFGLDILKGG